MIDCNIDNACNVAHELAQIEDQVFATNLKTIYLADHHIRVIYKMQANKIIGFMTFKRDQRSIEIYNLAVVKEYRRRGIASELLATVNDYDLSLEVRASNNQAICFYQANGFYHSYVRENYYQSEDAYVLERMRFATMPAYAKINLVLNVLNKRDDGYHDIEFLMTSVDIHDTVKVTRSEHDQVIVKNDRSLDGLDNLAYSALQCLRSKYGFKTKYKIEITKQIPVAAGMAGGSSDAAAVLKIINQLEDLGLSLAKLSEIGSEVGSDVSFCVYSKLAIARKRGEDIELVSQKLAANYVLVVNPGVALSTASVYKHHQIKDDRQSLKQILKASTLKAFEDGLHNTLASTAYELCPQMKQLYTHLASLTKRRILVSGSGPTLLVFSDKRDELDTLYDQIKDKYAQTYIAKIDQCT